MDVSQPAAPDKWDAEVYSENSSAQSIWAHELIEKLHLKGNENLLDIGCGNGNVSSVLASKLKDGHVIGIDSSHNMFSMAIAAIEHSEHENLCFHVMDARHITLRGKFDVAFSNAVLHLVDDHPAVLKGTRKHLNNDGRILFQMGGKGSAAELYSVINHVVWSSYWCGFFEGFSFPYHFYDVDDYSQWLPQNGFKAKRIELISKDMVHENTEGLKGWLRATKFDYTDRLPTDLRESFLDEIVTEYTASYPVDAKGQTHVNMIRLEVEAVAD